MSQTAHALVSRGVRAAGSVCGVMWGALYLCVLYVVCVCKCVSRMHEHDAARASRIRIKIVRERAQRWKVIHTHIHIQKVRCVERAGVDPLFFLRK